MGVAEGKSSAARRMGRRVEVKLLPTRLSRRAFRAWPARGSLRRALLALCLAAGSVSAAGPEWKAGAAKVAIAPRTSLWMAGYSARVKPSEGVEQEIWVKALALEDSAGQRSVLVTADMLGFTQGLSRRVAQRVERAHRIPRARLMLNASHTHCGPVVERQLAVAYDASEAQWADVDRYTEELENKVVAVIGEALKKLRPASLSFGQGEASFARNRRVAYNPNGPVDHAVPVLQVKDSRGRSVAVIFGYACHNTTLGGDFCKFHGDYSGVAQARLEKAHPGAMALFVTGCGADSNPNPRGTLAWVDTHGGSLASAVDTVLNGSLRPVRGPLRPAYREVNLVFDTPPAQADLRERLTASNKYAVRHARDLLARIEREGRLPSEYPYPVQVWKFGEDLTLIALAGEVVVDYSLRLKRELGGEKLWVAGYTNDVFAYIPSERVLQEGGYEGAGAMIYYGPPGPWAPGIEAGIINTVHSILREINTSAR